MTTYTATQITAIGGTPWTSRDGSKNRVYINNTADLLGLDITRYNTGNMSSAALNGEPISNTKAEKLLSAIEKLYLNIADGKIYFQWGWTADQHDKQELMATVMANIASKVHAATTVEPQAEPIPTSDDEQTATTTEPSTTIAHLRAAGRTVREIAAAIGVHTSTVYRWARGLFRPNTHRAAALTALTA